MKFYFEIDDETFLDEYGIDFQASVKDRAALSVADELIKSMIPDRYVECCEMVHDIIKDHTPEIIDRVTEQVAGAVAKKKAIVELTPKAREMAAADKDNIAYFEEMVDKAIAKKFR